MRRREFIGVLGAAAVAWPIKSVAQQQAMPVIGVLGTASVTSGGLLAAFHQGLKTTGHNEGQNVQVEYRWSNGDRERMPALAAIWLPAG